MSQALALARNIIVARFLLPEDFGIAAMLATTISILEMIGSLGYGDLIITTNPEAVEQVQSTTQRLNLFRSLFACVVVVSFAAPIAELFGAPQATWSFRWLGLIFLCKGALHMDLHRVKRNLNFIPEVKASLCGNATATLLALPIAYATRDFSAMLWLLMIRAIVETLASHWLAERPYRLDWHNQAALAAWRFGWPLQLNAVLLFGLYQGDRIIMASAPQLATSAIITLKDIGVYSAAFSIAVAPTLLLSKVSGALLLPIFAQNTEKHVESKYLYAKSAEIVSVISGILALSFIMLGELTMRSFYGSRYADGGIILAWLGASQATRLMRSPPTDLSTAHRDTRNALYSNIARVIGLGFVLLVVTRGYSLPWVAFIAFMSEFSALLISVFRVQIVNRIEASRCLWPIAPVGFWCMLAFFCENQLAGLHREWILPCWLVLVAGFVITMLICFPDLRSLGTNYLTKLRASNWRGAIARLTGSGNAT